MPTIMTHAVIPVGLALAAGRELVPKRLLIVGAALAMAPDLDVLGLRWGVRYEDSWGHRGASHSLVFAFIVSVMIWPFVRKFVSPSRSALGIGLGYLFLCMASHGLLDAVTNGGLGIALAWPWSDERFFFSWQPVEVSPLGVSRFFSRRGLEVLGSEFQWIVLPTLGIAVGLRSVRRSWRRLFPNSRFS